MKLRCNIFVPALFLCAIISCISCVNTKKVAYLNDVRDSVSLASDAGLEPVIQKNDLLSITVSSLSPQATLVFNTANITPQTSSANGNALQTTGYLVTHDGYIK